MSLVLKNEIEGQPNTQQSTAGQNGSPSGSSSKSSPSSKMAWVFWACAALFYLYEYILRVSPNVITNELMLDFSITSTYVGILVSAYYWAYVPLQIPCGVIVDWLGVRRVISASTLLCVVGSILFSQTDSLYASIFSRFLMGAGSACAYISCVKIAADWFAPQKFAVIAAITQMMGTFGGIAGAKPFAVLSNDLGWRQAMLILGLGGILVLLTAWFVIKEKPRKKEDVVNQSNLLDGLKAIKSNPQSWLIALYGGLMFVPISAFADLWGTPYLMQLYGINNEAASFAGIMVYLGFACGSPLGAMLSNYIQSRKKVMSWSSLLTIFPFMIVVYIPNIPYNVTLGLLFIAGLVCGGQILYFAAAKEINKRKYSATAIGFTNAGVMVSALVFQPLLGYILDFVWDGTLLPNGTPAYTISDYQHAMMTIPVCMIVAWVVMFFVRETYTDSPKTMPKETRK